MADEIKTTPNYEGMKEEKKPNKLPVLMIDRGDSPTSDREQQEVAWHDLKNSFITKRVLTGRLTGVETTPNDGMILGITDYKGIRIAIPAQELIETKSKIDNEGYSKAIALMIGAEINFMVITLDNDSQSVIASVIKANEKLRKTYYFDKDTKGFYKIYEGSIVEARIVGITRRFVRAEIFGALCMIPSTELSWTWVSDITSEFQVGDRVMVKITKITGRENQNEPFSVSASVRLAKGNKIPEIIRSMKKNNLYTGEVLDIRKGTYLLQLSNGVNAFAHVSNARKDIMKGDTVAFAVRFVDYKKATVSDSITRLIKRS